MNAIPPGSPPSGGVSPRSRAVGAPRSALRIARGAFSRRALFLCAAVAIVVARPPASQADAPDVPTAAHPDRPLHEAAHRAWMAGDLELALSLERQANAVAPSPVYMFQIARILEALGELQEAWEMYVIASANIGAEPDQDELRRLSADGAARLEAARQAAQFQFGTLPTQTIVQVDGVFVTDGDEPFAVPAGDRQVCFVERLRRRATCLHRRATVGRRTTVALPDDTAYLASLHLPPGLTMDRVFVDGAPLLANTAEIALIAVEPGRHVFGVAHADGNIDTVTHELLPGEVRALELVTRVAPPSSSGDATGAWVTTAIGGAMSIVGFALAGVAALERDAVRSAEVRDGLIVGMRQRDAVARLDHANNLDAWGLGLGVSGLAVASGGLIWALAANDDGDDDTPSTPPTEAAR